MTTTEAKPLTPAEAKLLKWALARLLENFSNAGCNDFNLKLDAGLSDQEWPEVARAIDARREECDQATSLSAGSFSDTEVVGYLRQLIGARV